MDQVFKVVSIHPPYGGMRYTFRDRFSSNAPPPHMLIYRKGKKVVPELGYIFAYRTYEDAVLFIERHCQAKTEIWLASAVVANWAPTQIGRVTQIPSFWKGYTIGLKPPSGTVWCSELTITRMVGYATNPIPGIVRVESAWPLQGGT
jgi:hypothetical protein